MAKNSLFHRALFGYAKEDVHAYILAQDRKVRELSDALNALEEKFCAYQNFYASLMRVYDENLAVLREVQIRAAASEERVRTLGEVFGALSEAYRRLYQTAAEQQSALATAKLYENKATKYDELAVRMKELVLPESMQTAAAPLEPLPEVGVLPEETVIDEYCVRADAALRELLSDSRALVSASARLQIPAPPLAGESIIG